MKIVIDTNRIIAAFVKDGTTRKILLNKAFEFVTPDYTITEIDKHKEELQVKTGLDDSVFEVLLALIFENIKIIPFLDYTGFVGICKGKISDPDDIPVLATALATRAQGIWVHDPHFLEQKRIKIFTNKDMLELIEGGI